MNDTDGPTGKWDHLCTMERPGKLCGGGSNLVGLQVLRAGV